MMFDFFSTHVNVSNVHVNSHELLGAYFCVSNAKSLEKISKKLHLGYKGLDLDLLISLF